MWRVYKVGALEVPLRGIGYLETGTFVAARSSVVADHVVGFRRTRSTYFRAASSSRKNIAQLNDAELTRWQREQVGLYFNRLVDSRYRLTKTLS
jgi:hypothetical protein